MRVHTLLASYERLSEDLSKQSVSEVKRLCK